MLATTDATLSCLCKSDSKAVHPKLFDFNVHEDASVDTTFK
jgi:hypothetical protein